MNRYRVYGDKTHKYFTIVTAIDPSNAWDFAVNNDNIDWFEIESNNSIEVFSVEEAEQIYELRRTKWTFRTKLWAKGPKNILRGYLQIP